MKIIWFNILCLTFVLVSCSKDDDPTVRFSSETINFAVTGGEEKLEVQGSSDNYTWKLSKDSEWLTIRRNTNDFRIIASANTTEDSRDDILLIEIDGHTFSLPISQAGMNWGELSAEMPFGNMTGNQNIILSEDLAYQIFSDKPWCKASLEGGSINIHVDANYGFEKRNAMLTISVPAYALSKKVTVSQSGAPWHQTFEMIEVEGGSFLMGAQKEDIDRDNYDVDAMSIEGPVHEVTLDSYYIGKFEVTQEQWEAAMGVTPSVRAYEKFPANNISWDEIQEFILKLNEATSLQYRLPTEAEWEYAARGGSDTKKTKYSGSDFLGNVGWYYANSEANLHEVGGKDSNELGLFDMSGNVNEWCMDYFDYYASEPVINPSGPEEGSKKVVRGGGWNNSSSACRVTYRYYFLPDERSENLGFRLVLEK